MTKQHFKTLIDNINESFAAKRLRIPKDQIWPELELSTVNDLQVLSFAGIEILTDEYLEDCNEQQIRERIVHDLNRISGAIVRFTYNIESL